MQEATFTNLAIAAGIEPHIATSSLPLTFVGAGNAATIAKVRGDVELHHHLETLGFVEGATVLVVSDNAGNLIVEVKGSRIAIDRKVAQKILAA